MASPAATVTGATLDQVLAERLGGEHRRRALVVALLDRLDECRRVGGGRIEVALEVSSDNRVRKIETNLPRPV